MRALCIMQRGCPEALSFLFYFEEIFSLYTQWIIFIFCYRRKHDIGNKILEHMCSTVEKLNERTLLTQFLHLKSFIEEL